MTTPPQVVTFGREYSSETIVNLKREVDAFAASQAKSVGVDLSQMVMIRSQQIGVLAQFVCAAERKGGAVVLHITTESLLELLKAGHFDKKTRIVWKDEEGFARELAKVANGVGPVPQTKLRPAVAPVPSDIPISADTRGAPSRLLDNRKMQMALAALCACCAVGMFVLAALVFVQKRDSDRSQAAAVGVALILQQKLDSLTAVVSQFKAEESLMNELSVPDTLGKKAP